MGGVSEEGIQSRSVQESGRRGAGPDYLSSRPVLFFQSTYNCLEWTEQGQEAEFLAIGLPPEQKKTKVLYK